MKRITFFAVLVAGLAALAFTAPVLNKTVNTSQSAIVWKAYKVTGSHTGKVALKSGSLQMQDGKLTGGSFVIDMNTITCTDLEGEWRDKLVGHLKSDDFFGVANHPEATFVITEVVSRGTPGSYKITGNLTIKEITKQIRFNTQLTEENGVTTAVSDLTLDRSDFDVRFGSGSFFDNLGDKTIYDDFELQVKLVTNN